MSADGFLSPLFTWRTAIASRDNGLTPTQRHVALTLSLHMNERGGSAFPSIRTLWEETGYGSKGTVTGALTALESAGWLQVDRPASTLTGSDGRGKSNHYRASVPVDNLPTEAEIKGPLSDPFLQIKGPVKGRFGPLKGPLAEPEDVEDVNKTANPSETLKRIPVDNPSSRPRKEWRSQTQIENDRRYGGEGARFPITTPEYLAEIEAKADLPAFPPPVFEPLTPELVERNEAAQARLHAMKEILQNQPRLDDAG